jgi:ABC-type multidrug transport system ATPase subunit
MPSPPEPVRLVVRALGKHFGPIRVLDAVDLDVGAGEVVLLGGGNGSGKTTLLRCIAGIARHTGTVHVDGCPTLQAAARAGLGYLPQAPGLPPWATGIEILTTFARLRGVAPALDRLPDGFLPPLDRAVSALSGGMRQRIAIALTLLGAPGVLLLDEPAANLDDGGRDALAGIIAAQASRGTAVVVAAPSPGDLAGVAHRTLRLADGQLTGEPGRPGPATTDGDVSQVHLLRSRRVAG